MKERALVRCVNCEGKGMVDKVDNYLYGFDTCPVCLGYGTLIDVTPDSTATTLMTQFKYFQKLKEGIMP